MLTQSQTAPTPPVQSASRGRRSCPDPGQRPHCERGGGELTIDGGFFPPGGQEQPAM